MIRICWSIILLHFGLCSCVNDQSTSDSGDIPSHGLEQIKLDESIERFHQILNRAESFQKILAAVGECNHSYLSKIQRLDFGTYYINDYCGTSEGVQMQIKYLVRDSTLVYGVISSIESNQYPQFENLEFCKDFDGLEEYIAAHKRFYNQAYTAEQVIQEVIKNELAVTIACGNGSINYGQDERRIFRAVKAQEVDYVNKVLRSVSPERQLLGVVALQKLIEDDFQPSQKMIQIRDHILERNSLISACISCSYGNTYRTLDYLDRIKWELVPNIDLE